MTDGTASSPPFQGGVPPKAAGWFTPRTGRGGSPGAHKRHWTAEVLLLSSLLGACSSIPFDPDKSRSVIAADIGVPVKLIELESRCNFFPFPYGRGAPGKMTACVFIQTPDSFQILGYNREKQAYFLWFRIPYVDIECALHDPKGPGKGMLSLLTGEYAYVVAIFRPDSDRLDYGRVDQVLAVLNAHRVRVIEHPTRLDYLPLRSSETRNICRDK